MRHEKHVDQILDVLRDKHEDAEVEHRHDFDSMDEKFRIRNRDGAYFLHVADEYLIPRSPDQASQHVAEIDTKPRVKKTVRYRLLPTGELKEISIEEITS